MSKIVPALSVAAAIALLLVLGGTLITVTGSQPEVERAPASGLGTAFTYQGYLTQSATPANGSFDLAFALYDDPEGGSQVGTTTSNTLTITDGLFTVELDFGSVFDGTPLWLEVGARPAGQTEPFTPLLPRQRLTPVPFSAFASVAASAPWAGLTDVPAGFADNVDDDTTYLAGTGLDLDVITFAISPTYQLPQTCGIGQTTKWNGSAWACSTDEVGAGGSAWLLTGNAETSPGTHFLGTTDNQALELGVNGSRVLRLEPSPTSPNLVAGYGGNSVDATTTGVTIGGGGRDLAINQVTDDFGTISGGAGNTASGYASTVGGGEGNSASGNYSTAAGGSGNSASGPYAAMGGGQANVVTGTHATLAGGGSNQASAAFAAVGGGYGNVVSGTYATISGGSQNEATGAHSSVGGGSYNSVPAAYGTIAGGGPSDTANPTTTSNRVFDDYGTVGGGGGNVAGDDEDGPTAQRYATVGGGAGNTASAYASTVGGGSTNTAGSYAATVSGGVGNSAGNQYATVSGGSTNTAGGSRSVVAGGQSNSATSSYATVSGGSNNQVTAGMGTVSGGYGNVVTATYGMIPGGAQNYVGGSYSMAAGRQARAEHAGTFVWADSSTSPFSSTGPDQFLINASGGVGIGTN